MLSLQRDTVYVKTRYNQEQVCIQNHRVGHCHMLILNICTPFQSQLTPPSCSCKLSVCLFLVSAAPYMLCNVTFTRAEVAKAHKVLFRHSWAKPLFACATFPGCCKRSTATEASLDPQLAVTCSLHFVTVAVVMYCTKGLRLCLHSRSPLFDIPHKVSWLTPVSFIGLVKFRYGNAVDCIWERKEPKAQPPPCLAIPLVCVFNVLPE